MWLRLTWSAAAAGQLLGLSISSQARSHLRQVIKYGALSSSQYIRRATWGSDLVINSMGSAWTLLAGFHVISFLWEDTLSRHDQILHVAASIALMLSSVDGFILLRSAIRKRSELPLLSLTNAKVAVAEITEIMASPFAEVLHPLPWYAARFWSFALAVLALYCPPERHNIAIFLVLLSGSGRITQLRRQSINPTLTMLFFLAAQHRQTVLFVLEHQRFSGVTDPWIAALLLFASFKGLWTLAVGRWESEEHDTLLELQHILREQGDVKFELESPPRVAKRRSVSPLPILSTLDTPTGDVQGLGLMYVDGDGDCGHEFGHVTSIRRKVKTKKRAVLKVLKLEDEELACRKMADIF